MEHAPELLPELLARSAELAMRGLWLCSVEKSQLPRRAPKAVNEAIESANTGAGCAQDTARDAPGARPRLNPESCGANFQRIFAGIEWHQLIAEFQQRRTFAGCEKARNQSPQRGRIVR